MLAFSVFLKLTNNSDNQQLSAPKRPIGAISAISLHEVARSVIEQEDMGTWKYGNDADGVKRNGVDIADLTLTCR